MKIPKNAIMVILSAYNQSARRLHDARQINLEKISCDSGKKRASKKNRRVSRDRADMLANGAELPFDDSFRAADAGNDSPEADGGIEAKDLLIGSRAHGPDRLVLFESPRRFGLLPPLLRSSRHALDRQAGQDLSQFLGKSVG